MTDLRDHPLLENWKLPPFDRIDPAVVAPALDRVLAENEETVEAVARRARDAADGLGFDDVIAPLEAASDRISRVWSPIRHLHAVADTPELRAVHEAGLQKLAEQRARLGQHEGLFRAYRALREAPGFDDLEPAQRMVVENALRDFRLSGIELEPAQRDRFREISQRLSELSNRFSRNLLDATDAWSLRVPESRLTGLPEAFLQKVLAAGDPQAGEALLLLDGPTYQAVLTHADDRDLRRALYRAWTTRASELDGGDNDNGPLIDEILALRHEQATLLGHDNYAQRRMETRMASSPEEVLEFLGGLAERTRPVALEEFDELRAHGREVLGIEELQAWDLAWIGEHLRRARHDLSQEMLRPWFPVDRVLEGMFATVRRLFGIEIRERHDLATWHPDVRTFGIHRDGEPVGCFYLDLYARRHKQGGAWMDGCLGRRRTTDGIQMPVAFLTCNFGGPVGDRPALLTHDEATTLFHEFGHGLHHMLTRVDLADVAGISGVPWDVVELPSQFLENWCWHPEGIELISGHWETGEPLPRDLVERMLAARNFHSAMMVLRQLEFGLFDLRLHREYVPDEPGQVRRILAEVRESVGVVPVPEFNRFENGFGHIFAGGYAAGYYSYMWAEVLSSDAFSRFEEEGVFDARVGRAFLEHVLERGGSEPPAELFRRFRGRDPEMGPLLRHRGIEAPELEATES